MSTRVNDYKAAIGVFVGWCDENHLQINVNKTEEVIIDPRSVTVVHGEAIKQGGIWGSNIWGSTLTVSLRVMGVCKGPSAPTFSKEIFYKATIESIVRYGIVVWFGSLTVKLRAQINNLVGTPKIMWTQTISSLQDISERCSLQQANEFY